jgi:hypothetical protein
MEELNKGGGFVPPPIISTRHIKRSQLYSPGGHEEAMRCNPSVNCS